MRLLSCFHLCNVDPPLFPTRLTDPISGLNLVLPQERCRIGSRCSRLIFGRCHLPHNGHPPNSPSWLRLDHAHMRVSHPGAPHLRQFDSQVAHTADETSLEHNGIHSALERTLLHSTYSVHLLLLLGHVCEQMQTSLMFHPRLIAFRSHSPSSFSKPIQRACLSIWLTT